MEWILLKLRLADGTAAPLANPETFISGGGTNLANWVYHVVIWVLLLIKGKPIHIAPSGDLHHLVDTGLRPGRMVWIWLLISASSFFLPESNEYVSIQSEPRLLDSAMPFSTGDVNVTSIACGARHTAVTLGKYTLSFSNLLTTFLLSTPPPLPLLPTIKIDFFKNVYRR